VREKEGAASSLDEGLQSVEVQKLVAEHAQIEQSRRATLGAIAVLVGREAPSFTLAAEPLERLTLPAIDPGQPGDLMFRRPDVQAAEARIVAAHGDLQQARAAFLPGLHLSGSALGQALALAGPFGLTLTAAESITAPIFQAGRLRSRFDEATAAQVEMVALYRQSLLQALQEGDAALAAGTTTSARESALRDTAVQARHTVDLARRQYVDGDADLASLLDAQRNSIQIEDAVIQARQDRLTAAIDLYKALGGTPRP
jgi:outer membrane protein TolC